MSRKYHHFADAPYLYFITSTIVEWIPIFLSFRYFNILLDAFSYCRENKGLLLHAYVIMPNHFHAIVSSRPTQALPNIMRDMKRYTSREITYALEQEHSEYILRQLAGMAPMGKGNTDYKVWQDGYHPVAIYTQKFFRQKLEYLHDNPVRKGFVRRPEDWLYSSAFEYVCGEKGLIEIDRLEV